MKQEIHLPTKEQIETFEKNLDIGKSPFKEDLERMKILVMSEEEFKEFKETPFVPILPFEGKLETVLEAFRQHKLISRVSKSKEYLFIYQQIPAKIELSIVPKMTSVPDGVKEVMEQLQKEFNYQNQAVKVDKDGNTTYWIPTIEDLLAEDWYILED